MIYILTLWEDDFNLVGSYIFSNKKQAIKHGKEHEKGNDLSEDLMEGEMSTTYSFNIESKVTPRNKKEWIYLTNYCLLNHMET